MADVFPGKPQAELKEHLLSKGEYRAEPKKRFVSKGGRSFLRSGGQVELHSDGKYFYAAYPDKHKFDIHSLDSQQLIMTIRCPVDFRPSCVLSVKQKFCVVNLWWENSKKLLIFDENGNVSDEVTLPSGGEHLSNNGSNKVIITCFSKEVVSYDVETRKLETISTPAVDEIFETCWIGGDEYVMRVRINYEFPIIKCVQGNIVKSIGGFGDGFNNPFMKGSFTFALDWSNKLLRIFDGDLQLLSSFSVHASVYFQFMSVDSDWNIHIAFCDNEDRFYIKKYVL